MKRAAVSTLKATLSACLAKVKVGDEVLVALVGCWGWREIGLG